MNVSLLIANDEWRRCKCQRAVHDGLRALGHHVKVDRPAAGPRRAGENFNCCFIWNGIHSNRGDAVRAFRAAGKPAFIMERGFFNRMVCTQIDAVGFNHTASWADTLAEPAPREGRGRFEAAWGSPPAPLRARDTGHILILLQVPADSQLKAAEIHHSGPLADAVEDATPEQYGILVRRHPLSGWSCGRDRGGRPRRARMTGGNTLAEDVAAARFCVTINSNAGNEALALGCPVLCLGPALYEMAGVAIRTRLADMAESVRQMLDGWGPAHSAVERYLYHLACRQYGIAELRSGEALRRLGF